LKII
jgi:hypothetical protein